MRPGEVQVHEGGVDFGPRKKYRTRYYKPQHFRSACCIHRGAILTTATTAKSTTTVSTTTTTAIGHRGGIARVQLESHR